MVGQLKRRFKATETRESSQRLFYSRTLRVGGNVRHFAADLKTLSHKASPMGLTSEVREDMLLKQFFDGLSDEDIRYNVMCLQRPRSLDAAVDLVQEYRSYKSRDKQREKRHAVRVIAEEEPETLELNSESNELAEVRAVGPINRKGSVYKDIEELRSDVKNLTKAVSQLLATQKVSNDSSVYQGKTKEPRKCYNCGGLGHFIDVCPSPRKKREKSEEKQEEESHDIEKKSEQKGNVVK